MAPEPDTTTAAAETADQAQETAKDGIADETAATVLPESTAEAENPAAQADSAADGSQDAAEEGDAASDDAKPAGEVTMTPEGALIERLLPVVADAAKAAVDENKEGAASDLEAKLAELETALQDEIRSRVHGIHEHLDELDLATPATEGDAPTTSTKDRVTALEGRLTSLEAKLKHWL